MVGPTTKLGDSSQLGLARRYNDEIGIVVDMSPGEIADLEYGENPYSHLMARRSDRRCGRPDATTEKVRTSGAEVFQALASQLWGVRDYAFRDPSGNLVRIQQRSCGSSGDHSELEASDRDVHVHYAEIKRSRRVTTWQYKH